MGSDLGLDGLLTFSSPVFPIVFMVPSRAFSYKLLAHRSTNLDMLLGS